MSLVSSGISYRIVSESMIVYQHSHKALDLLQVLSILTMERPVSFAAEDIRDEKVSRNYRQRN